MTSGVGIDAGGAAAYTPPPMPPDPMAVLSQIAQANISGNTSGSPAGNMLISPFGELIVSLIQLAMQNTQMFQQSAAETASKLQQQAEQQTNAQTQQYLDSVAKSLQQASQTGVLPQLPTPSNQSILAYTSSGLPLKTNSLTFTTEPGDGVNLDQLFQSLAVQVQAASSTSGASDSD